MLLGNPAFRPFSRTAVSRDLLADRYGGIRGISKSTLERASKFFAAGQVRWMNQVLIEMIGKTDRAKKIGLVRPMKAATCLVNTTGLEADISFRSTGGC